MISASATRSGDIPFNHEPDHIRVTSRQTSPSHCPRLPSPEQRDRGQDLGQTLRHPHQRFNGAEPGVDPRYAGVIRLSLRECLHRRAGKAVKQTEATLIDTLTIVNWKLNQVQVTQLAITPGLSGPCVLEVSNRGVDRYLCVAAES